MKNIVSLAYKTPKKMNRKITFGLGCFIALLISLSPFLLYIHTFIPEGVENYETYFGVIKGGQFERAHVFIYLLLNKFVPLFLLTLLYLTHKSWWSHVILIPIATYLFQFIAIISESQSTIDEVEYIYVIPITIIILTPLYFIRGNLSVYLHALDLKKEMDAVIKKPKL